MAGSIYQTVFGGNVVAPALPTYLPLNISTNVILGWPLESNITSPAAAEIIDVTATVGGLTVQLSDARQVGTGYCALFNNVGANTFTLLDAQGNVLMAPASGQAWQIYLADNSTLQGTWRVFQYGAGVSSANAASLAGSGLKAITTTLNTRIVINPQAVNYTVGSGLGQDRASCIEWTGGAGGVLSSSTAAVLGSDWFCYIKNSGTGVVTFTPGSGTINGSASQTFNPNDSAILVTDGVNFFTIGLGQSVASSFNFVAINLTGLVSPVVLSGAQLNRVSYKFTGVLTAPMVVQVPASIQQYWVDNETTGAFTLTISAGGVGSTFAVPQATRTILYCDGLNIVNAVSSGAGSVTLVADGTAAAPGLAWASDTQMGLYKVGADTLGIATAGIQRVVVNSAGAVSINAPSAGPALLLNGANGYGNQVLTVVGAAANSAGIEMQDGNAGNRTYYIRVGALGTGVFDIFDNTAGVPRVQISPTGNFTIDPPSAGVSLAVDGIAGGVPLQVLPAAAADLGIVISGAVGNQGAMRVDANGAVQAFWGVAGAANQLITGSITGETCLRAQGGGLNISTDSGATIGFKVLPGSAGVQAKGPVAATLVDLTPDTGTFNGAATGMTAGVNYPCTWTRIGKLVTLNIGGATGTSNSTAFTMTGLPAAIQPATVSTRIQLNSNIVFDNGTTGTDAEAVIASGLGTITFLKNGVAGGWTNGNQKGFGAGTSQTISYLLN